MKKPNATSIRMSATLKKLLDLLSEKYDISKPAIIELAVREYAEKRNIEINNE